MSEGSLILASLLISEYGVPALTFVLGPAEQLYSRVLQHPPFRQNAIKALVTDLPWGEVYKTTPDWEQVASLLKNVCTSTMQVMAEQSNHNGYLSGSIPGKYETMEDEKGVEQMAAGGTAILLMGDLLCLGEMNSKACKGQSKLATFKNTPGMICWSNPMNTNVKTNAPKVSF